jgi:Sulfate permease and related transporters (MFS superfamily)
LAVLILGKLFLKNKPVALFVVIGAIVAASAFSLDTRGVKLLGNVPQGLPPLGMPAIHWDDLNQLLALAFACFLLGAVETAAIGRMFVAKHGGRLTPTRNFLHLPHQTSPLESAVVFPSAEECHSPSSMKVLVLAHHSQTRSPPASFLSLFCSFHTCLAPYRSRCLRLSFWWRWLVYSRSQLSPTLVW